MFRWTELGTFPENKHLKGTQLISAAWSYHEQRGQRTQVLANQVFKRRLLWCWTKYKTLSTGQSQQHLVFHYGDRLVKHDVNLLIPEAGVVLLTLAYRKLKLNNNGFNLCFVGVFSPSKSESERLCRTCTGATAKRNTPFEERVLLKADIPWWGHPSTAGACACCDPPHAAARPAQARWFPRAWSRHSITALQKYLGLLFSPQQGPVHHVDFSYVPKLQEGWPHDPPCRLGHCLLLWRAVRACGAPRLECPCNSPRDIPHCRDWLTLVLSLCG